MLSCITSRFWRAMDQRAVISGTSGFPSISVLFSLTVTCQIQNSKLCPSGLIGTPPNSSEIRFCQFNPEGRLALRHKAEPVILVNNSRDFRQEALPFPLMAQRGKNLPAVQEAQEIQVRSLSQEDPLQEGMATHSSILAWRIPMDRGAWRATVHGVEMSWTRLSN